MVTKEEFGQLIAEFESYRDLMMDEIAKLKEEIENLKDNIDDIARETKTNINKKIN